MVLILRSNGGKINFIRENPVKTETRLKHSTRIILIKIKRPHGIKIRESFFASQYVFKSFEIRLSATVKLESERLRMNRNLVSIYF